MLRRLAGSLLFRLIVLVVVVVVTTQVVTVYIAAGERHKLMDKQLYAPVVDTLAFLAGSMDNMNPARTDRPHPVGIAPPSCHACCRRSLPHSNSLTRNCPAWPTAWSAG